MSREPKIIAVIGGRECDRQVYEKAYTVGKAIAERGAVLVCGGKTGVMEAACRGAAEAGGLTIGILPGYDDREANKWVKIAIPTGVGIARNSIIACACHAAIAIDGSYGTLSEIAYCKQMDRPVVSLGSWKIEGVPQVESAEEALSLVFNDE